MRNLEGMTKKEILSMAKEEQKTAGSTFYGMSIEKIVDYLESAQRGKRELLKDGFQFPNMHTK